MFRQIVRRFSSIQQGPQGNFNILSTFGRIKSALRAPIKHIKRQLEPSGVDYQPLTNTTQEAFDEVAQEWQALVVGNAYELNIMQPLEAAIQNNFGTVDNPHVVFTSEAPFRYTICTGQPNEDDYEGHEALVFMLREGPLNRCPSCGQVYKLVRLRDEFSAEMDYYKSGLMPYEMQEMGDSDHTINLSLTRFFLKDTYEHTSFEQPSRMVYRLVNPDEHDRILTDPAYRLEKTKLAEDQMKVYLTTLQQIEEEYIENFGPIPRQPLSKVDYEVMFEVEKAIRKLDRLFRRVEKYNLRRYIDRENHERREARMQERAKQRWDNNYTIYTNELTEDEQKYRDYFETELENYPDNEGFEQKLDEIELQQRSDYQLQNIDFQELYTNNPEEDITSILQKKAFRFKYRLASDSLETYQRRQARMIERQFSRQNTDNSLQKAIQEYQNATLNGDQANQILAQNNYYNALSQEAVQLYKDYYQSEGEEEFGLLNNLTPEHSLEFIQVFDDYTQFASANIQETITIPKRNWNNSFGFWKNFVLEFSDYKTTILPTATRITNASQLSNLTQASTDRLTGKTQETIHITSQSVTTTSDKQ